MRTPFPLTTSVASRSRGTTAHPAWAGPRSWCTGRRSVHLRQVRGRPPAGGPRGNPLSMEQWECLAGGVRHPLPERDEIRRPGHAASSSGGVVDVPEIGVIHRGRLYALPIATGQAAAAAADRGAGVAGGARTGRAARDRAAVGALSYLGSGVAAPLLERLTADAHDAAVSQAHRACSSWSTWWRRARRSVERLERSALEVGHAWACQAPSPTRCAWRTSGSRCSWSTAPWTARHDPGGRRRTADITVPDGASRRARHREAPRVGHRPGSGRSSWRRSPAASQRGRAATACTAWWCRARTARSCPSGRRRDAAQQLILLLAARHVRARARGLRSGGHARVPGRAHRVPRPVAGGRRVPARPP
ncbi:hypothetical protein QJS66_13405 [Kocuria rhizophila]|nr:hypothetical protein QJS66_13405 [Kocuria rhizophila]